MPAFGVLAGLERSPIVSIQNTVGGACSYSTDGANWKLGTCPGSLAQSPGNAYGNGVFVGICGFTLASSAAVYSPDGITWTQVSMPASLVWTRVVFGNGVFVAIPSTAANTAAASTTDGKTWTAQTLPSSQSWQTICFDSIHGVFVAGASGVTNRATSPDGHTWTARTGADANACSRAAAAGNGIVTHAATTHGEYSTDGGATWNTYVPPTTTPTWIGYSPSLNQFVMVSSASTNQCWTSTDGHTWTARTMASTAVWNSVSWIQSQNLWYATGPTTWNTSPDGINWTAVTSQSGSVYGFSDNTVN